MSIFNKEPLQKQPADQEQQPTAAQQGESYKFVNSDIREYIEELNQPKQYFPEDSSVYEKFPSSAPEESTNTSSEGLKANMQVAKSTAKLIVTTIDSVLPEMMRFAAKAESSEDFKAEPEIKQELEQAFGEYIKLKGVGDIPPGVMVMMLLLVAYGSKMPMVLQLRKANTQSAQYVSEIEKLTAEIEKLKKGNKDAKGNQADNHSGS